MITSIPEDKLPDFFKDEIRLNVLYAPLRSKYVNPNDWNTKINSWREVIYLYCTCNAVYSFSLESLQAIFNYNGRTPSCLNEVIQQMEMNGDIEHLESFLQKKSKSWKKWASNKFIYTPVSWLLNKMKNILVAPSLAVYVPLKLVEKEADLLLNKILEYHKDTIISLRELLELENKTICKEKDFKILLTSLYIRGKVDILELLEKNMNEIDNFLIKVSDGIEVEPITEVDIGIHTLKRNEKVIKKNIEVLEEDISKCISDSKMHILRGHRQSARACLRKKHDLENIVSKKTNALYNVQILLHKLLDSKIDEDIWKSYQKAISAFESTYKKGINEDLVEETMLKVGEFMEINADIQSALATPIVIEDVDLEEELENLFQEVNNGGENQITISQSCQDQNVSEALKNLDLNLPNVPSSTTSKKSAGNISTQLS